jgi:hypothetical protein
MLRSDSSSGGSGRVGERQSATAADDSAGRFAESQRAQGIGLCNETSFPRVVAGGVSVRASHQTRVSAQRILGVGRWIYAAVWEDCCVA